MSELIVEYLYFAKKELPEEINKVFKKSISPYVVDSQLKCEVQGEKLMCDYDIVPYNDSLHVVFKYEKLGKIGLKEVRAFQETLKKVNTELSKSRLKHTTLLDTSSLFLSKKLLPYLHKYEWSMRKLIYLIAPTYFIENWLEDSIPEEEFKKMRKKAKNEWNPDNPLQWMDLSDFEEYLFGENYVQINGENEKSVLKIKELSAKELLDLIQGRKISLSKAYSLWEEIFDKYLEVELDEIQTDMQLIREGRNTVGHNKELNVSLCLVLLKKLKKYIKHLDNAFQKILIGDIGNEELDIMADDLNGYINYKLDATKLNTMKQTLGSMESVMSRLQEMNTSGLGNLISRIQEMNTDGFGSAVSRIQEMNTSRLGSVISKLQELSVYYSEEKKNSELALEKIKEEYGDVQPKFNENGEILLTPEDELRMEQAINQYLAMIGFNPRMRGVGKNWWNSTGFVAGVIDAGLIVLGLGLANSSVNTIKAIIRKNKRNIARVTENVIVAQIGITTVRGKALAAVEIALALAGTSAGGLIAEGLDRVDGRNDNYLWA
ncbi:hypothetical protein NG849_04265 [Enterococcus faecium]|uniref:hypothetical protein n=1 Tax=Enterococcus faecium TaxID=1352 RepID=UPI0020911962|nr:hypothetical protein [Enterococcus faecium]MCO5506792.1 hypothetical protein [Enterococcus faecium]